MPSFHRLILAAALAGAVILPASAQTSVGQTGSVSPRDTRNDAGTNNQPVPQQGGGTGSGSTGANSTIGNGSGGARGGNRDTRRTSHTTGTSTGEMSGPSSTIGSAPQPSGSSRIGTGGGQTGTTSTQRYGRHTY